MAAQGGPGGLRNSPHIQLGHAGERRARGGTVLEEISKRSMCPRCTGKYPKSFVWWYKEF